MTDPQKLMAAIDAAETNANEIIDTLRAVQGELYADRVLVLHSIGTLFTIAALAPLPDEVLQEAGLCTLSNIFKSWNIGPEAPIRVSLLKDASRLKDRTTIVSGEDK